MKIYLFIILSCTTFCLAGQTVDSSYYKIADSLLKVVNKLVENREYDPALKLLQSVENDSIHKLDFESVTYGIACSYHGRILYNKLNYDESEKWLLKSIAILEKYFSKERPEYALSLNDIAVLYTDSGKFEQADSFSLKAYAVCKAVLGNEHKETIFSLLTLANTYLKFAKYDNAESYYLEAKTLWEKYIGKDQPRYADILNNLAVLYQTQGRYENAEELYLETKTIRGKLLGKVHADYASTLFNLGGLYHELGNYQKAESLYLEAKSIWEELRDIDNTDYATCLINIVSLYDDTREYQKAKSICNQAKPIWQNILRNDNPEYAFGLLNTLATLYIDMGELNVGDSLLLESKSILEKAFGNEHPDFAMCLNNLGELYKMKGEYEKADTFYQQAISIWKKTLGIQHPYYVYGLASIASLYEFQKRYAETDLVLMELANQDQSNLIKASTYLSEIELRNYVATYQIKSEELFSYLITRHNHRVSDGLLSELAYQNILFYKGFLLNAVSKLNNLVRTSLKGNQINMKLKEVRKNLAAEYAKPISERTNIGELEEKSNSLEKELVKIVSGYGNELQQVKWQDLRNKLKDDEAAIEFIDFHLRFPAIKDNILYTALILKSGKTQPEFVPLCNEESLDSLLHFKSEHKSDYVNALYTISDRGAVALQNSGRPLYDILWRPMEKSLIGMKTIYFSPVGLLHRINLDAIPVPDRADAIAETLADKYHLIELGSTRQFVISDQIRRENKNAILLGGILFEKDSTAQKSEQLITSRSLSELSFNLVESRLRGGSWNYLPGTEREVNAIEKIMQSSGINVQVKKGYDASEEYFKSIGTNNNPSPRILHIATHGYFFPDPKEKMGSSQLAVGGHDPIFKVSDHPMLRSGIILGGGNATWQGTQTLEGREDGILTAYEISQMNLSNTELVVLSACETGLGDIQGNEGVYGLQRAFKIAGAKYLIMSLWQVPDKQTSLLMTTFYKKWLGADDPAKGGNKMTIPDAFHAAQKELRDLGLDPYQWAGFVLVE
jgi:CHAT domain-containing protein/tetratricopeptide (TPR) repeat protein